MSIDVSIIIVNWNTCKITCDCLRSVYVQTRDISFEVIVVDNASSDDSVEVIKKDFPQVVLVENDSNCGYAAGCNSGMRVANGRYVLILNSDIIICDSAIQKTLLYAHDHPKAAVIGCQVWDDPDHVQMTCFMYPSLLNLFLRMSGLARVFQNNQFFGREDMRWWNRDSERNIEVVSGMFMFVRREAMDEIGLMDEDYFLYYEETDWCYRFAKAGWEMLFWPGAKILHLDGGGHSSKGESLKLGVQMQKSLLIFMRKHYGLLSSIVARFIVTLYSGMKYFEYALRSFVKRMRGKDFSFELTKRKKCCSVFLFCTFGIEVKD